MAGGQMCLLLPTRLDRLSQVRRRPVVPRCLFGPPDPVETEKLLQEQMQRERDRFQRKWNIDLDLLEAEVEKSLKKASTVDVKQTKEDRIPPVPTAAEERLASADSQVNKGEKIVKSSSSLPEQKICRKPCIKFQKRVRVASRLKRQTSLTEFWRSRRSLGFVFGKGKGMRGVGVSLQVTEVLELETPARD